jgi:DNA-binding response OmpR family regulator
VLRREGTTPIIMLTARIEDTDKIVGLELGADDYVTKPFNPRELVARIRAVLRRSAPAAEPAPAALEAGPLRLDGAGHVASLDGRALDLTPTEFELLRIFMQHPGRAFTRLELLDRAMGEAYDGYERTVDAHIKNLRAKLGDDPRRPRFIQTVFGVGYKLGADL